MWSSSLFLVLPLLSGVHAGTFPRRLVARQGANGGQGGNNNNNGDAQSSLTLLTTLVNPGFADNGQGGANPDPNQVASLTSVNNYINFCATVNLPLTNGQQLTTASCNPTIMGDIAGTNGMPSCNWKNPRNLDIIAERTPFTIEMRINNMETGFFGNAKTRYFDCPQEMNAAGQIKGHSHVVIEKIPSFDSTEVTDPTQFAFFKGFNDKAANGVLKAEVPEGLPAGFYRIGSITSSQCHQPVLVNVAQHGSFDCAAYFEVRPANQIPNPNQGGNQNGGQQNGQGGGQQNQNGGQQNQNGGQQNQNGGQQNQNGGQQNGQGGRQQNGGRQNGGRQNNQNGRNNNGRN